MKSPETKLIAIFGWPLDHTLSPVFQNAGLRKIKFPALYLSVPLQPSEFLARARELQALPSFLGANVTIPHKLAALRLGKPSAEAKAIGAVNTLYRKGKGWAGDNTDARGFILALKAQGVRLRKQKVLLLGAGGSARAIAYGVLAAGASLVVASRRLAQAGTLKRRFKRLGPCAAVQLKPQGLAALMAKADIIVSTVPGAGFAAVAAKALAGQEAAKVVCDISYGLRKNPLLKMARARGHQALDGSGMLLEQGRLSFKLWTGKTAPREVMRRALAKAY